LPINEEILAEGLSLLCKTGNGLTHAYVRLDAAQRELTDISILKNYIHLRYIDLSNNNLIDISSLNSLTHLLTLKLDNNKLTSAKLDPLPYLQHASFSNNRIKNTEGIAQPKLEILNLNSKILLLVFTSTPSLKKRCSYLVLTSALASQIKRDGTSYDLLGVVDHADYESDIFFFIRSSGGPGWLQVCHILGI
jgi:Leucine-rich repeat (LRR) protein